MRTLARVNLASSDGLYYLARPELEGNTPSQTSFLKSCKIFERPDQKTVAHA
jgi:hypothetical protein